MSESCFVIGPIGDKLTAARERMELLAKQVIEPAVSGRYEVRYPHLGQENDIMAEVFAELRSAALVIADITGKNPNVLYELGFRHATGLDYLIFAKEGTALPFDLGQQRVIYYNLAKLEDARRELSARVEAISKKNGAQTTPAEWWREVRPLLENPPQLGELQSVVSQIVGLACGRTHRLSRVIRLWGNQGRLGRNDQRQFQEIAQCLGRACMECDSDISVGALNHDTLDFWALSAALDAAKQRKNAQSRPHQGSGIVEEHPVPRVYLHHSSLYPAYTGEPGAKLFKKLAPSFERVDICYPQHDAAAQLQLNPRLAHERSPNNDARLGSLLQCSSVILLGGNHSARLLIQLLKFIEEQKIRIAEPIYFIPIPWVPGVGRVAFERFNGFVGDLPTVASL